MLILVSHLDHQFAIWGDGALHDKAGQLLWKHAKKALIARFAERQYAEGTRPACARSARNSPSIFQRHMGHQITNEITESG